MGKFLKDLGLKIYRFRAIPVSHNKNLAEHVADQAAFLETKLKPILAAAEPTGVVAESQIQVAQIAFDVVEAVRIDHAERGAGKIVVQSFLGLLRVEPALPEQKPQEFLVFGIHAHDGVGSLHESGAVVGDDLKLPIAMNVASQRQRFASLATSQAMAFQKLRHDGDTHAKASPQKFLGNLGT